MFNNYMCRKLNDLPPCVRANASRGICVVHMSTVYTNTNHIICPMPHAWLQSGATGFAKWQKYFVLTEFKKAQAGFRSDTLIVSSLPRRCFKVCSLICPCTDECSFRSGERLACAFILPVWQADGIRHGCPGKNWMLISIRVVHLCVFGVIYRLFAFRALKQVA